MLKALEPCINEARLLFRRQLMRSLAGGKMTPTDQYRNKRQLYPLLSNKAILRKLK
jgi:hypothetical protein